MYLDFYGLSEFPFQLTPDSRFFFGSDVHTKALAHLMFGLNQAEGFIVITGDVGTGKTTLLGRLVDVLDRSKFVIGRIVSSQLQGDDLVRSVASGFGLAFTGLDKVTLLRHIEEFLGGVYKQGKRALLMVDEAQNLSHQAVEELRMLSNFQVGNRVPLQCVLLGQPQFRKTMTHPDLEQFRQRVVAAFHMRAMTAEETDQYIRHRLTKAGWRNNPEFAPEALSEIFAQTGGVPRRINVFCARLMFYAFLESLHHIDRAVVESVAQDLADEVAEVMDYQEDATGLGGGAFALPVGAQLVDDALLRRIEKLERLVEKHNRALRYLSTLAEGGEL